MRFFFLDEELEHQTGPWVPPRDLQAHLKALRLEADERFLLLGPSGRAVLARPQGRGAFELEGASERPRQTLFPVRLATAWPKGKRAEDLVLRACEAGVAEIQPVLCSRSVAGRESLSNHQQGRFQRIAREACQQLLRPELPQIHPEPVSLESLFPVDRGELPVILKPGARPLAQILVDEQPSQVLLFVGPEGGWSPEEEEQLLTLGCQAAGLVPTVLRIEAAGPLAAALCQHQAMVGKLN